MPLRARLALRAPDRVRFVALERQHALIEDELREAFSRVLDSSGFILGEEVERSRPSSPTTATRLTASASRRAPRRCR